MRPTRNNASILRKKILQEIKKLLNERTVEDLAAAVSGGTKSVANVASVKNDLKAALKTEMDALDAAGKDISQLRKLYDDIGEITDSKTFVEALAQARAKVREAASSAATSAASSSTRAAADVTDNPAAATNAAQEVAKIDPDNAGVVQNIINQGRTVPVKDRFAWFKKWWDNADSVKYCRSKPKVCASIGAGIGLGAAALAYFGLSGGEDAPSSQPTPTGDGNKPAPGGGETAIPPQVAQIVPGTPNVKTQSIRCDGDTTKDSIVAKYQRHVGVYPDGVFGKKTYAAGKNKGGDAVLPNNWEDYFKNDPNTSAKLICTWLKTPGKSWSNSDGKIGSGGKGTGGKGKGTGGKGKRLSYTIKLVNSSMAPDFGQAARAIAELLTDNSGNTSVLDLTINTDPAGMQEQDRLYDLLKRKLIQAQGMSEEEISRRIKPTFVEFYEEGEESQSEEERLRREKENLEESWHRKHQTSCSNNLFERLVKSVNNKKVI